MATRLPNFFLEGFADTEVNDTVSLNGLALDFIAKRDDLFVGDL